MAKIISSSLRCYCCGDTPCSEPTVCNAVAKSLIETIKPFQIEYMIAMKKAEQLKPVYSSYRGVIFDLGAPWPIKLGNIVFQAHKDYLEATLKFMNL